MNGATIGCSIFFRAGSYHPERLRASWQRWVLSHAPLVEVAGRLVVLGDHTHVVKDGGRMPGVVSLRETSETQSKPDYFRGQCWGAVGLLVGSLSACFCLPLSLQIHQGFRHLGEEDSNDPALKLGTRVVQMALSFAQVNDRPVWLVLDAFFATASVFRLACSVWSVALQQPLVQVITRAKKNYVAYFPAPPKPPGRRGRQRQYGMKLVLWEAFDHADFFREVTLCIYGKEESVRLIDVFGFGAGRGNHPHPVLPTHPD
ncbi:MAG: transposase [Candidatus Thiothrix putei]|uniref:Transposase n=1 Tax=Candidatus Thiothrix putei TaxID=3080811 RepID=A0AA95HBK3_9GAMM|nr:MAG: transposase [Candidatus Thiothrix putei]